MDLLELWQRLDASKLGYAADCVLDAARQYAPLQDSLAQLQNAERNVRVQTESLRSLRAQLEQVEDCTCAVAIATMRIELLEGYVGELRAAYTWVLGGRRAA